MATALLAALAAAAVATPSAHAATADARRVRRHDAAGDTTSTDGASRTAPMRLPQQLSSNARGASCATLHPSDCAGAPGGCGAAIAAAAEKCSAAGGGTVSLTAGDFPLSSSGDLVAAVGLTNVSGVTIEGADDGLTAACTPPTAQSTRLVLQELAAGFSVAGGTDLSLRRLHMDAARLPYTLGVLRSVNATASVFTFDESVYPFAGSPVSPWLFKVLAVMEYDESCRCPPHGGADIYATSDPISLVLTAPGTLTLLRGSVALPAKIDVGKQYVLRHAVYGGNGVTVSDTSRVIIDRVQLWSAPGMGFYSGGAADVTIVDSGACRKGDLPVSVTADASHFNECLGTITLDRVHFEGQATDIGISTTAAAPPAYANVWQQGDDGCNIHGMFHAVLRSLPTPSTEATAANAGGESGGGGGASNGGATATFVLGSRPAGGVSPLHVGETYEFRNRTTWLIEGTGVLQSYKAGTDPLTQEATFAMSAGATVSQWSLLTDVSRAPSVLIQDSFFGHNRARGILVKTSNAVIQGNSFGPVTGPCVQAFPDGCYWFESGGFHNWTVRNNTLSGCGGGPTMGDVFVAACAPQWRNGAPLSQGGPVTTGQPFAAIAVQGNTFRQLVPQSAVAIWGSDGLTITDNTVEVASGATAAVGKRSVRVPNGSDGISSANGEAASPARRGSLAAPPPPPGLLGSFDGFELKPSGSLEIHGWVVDKALPATTPSNVSVSVDGVTVVSVAPANVPRPDLVPVVTSDPHHGFDITLPNTTKWVTNHTVQVFAIRAGGVKVGLHGGPVCVTEFRQSCSFPQDCRCGAPVPSAIRVSNSVGCDVEDNVCYGKPCGATPGGCA